LRFADCRCQGRPGGQDRRQDGGRQEGQGKHGQYTSTSAPPGLLHSASRLETFADSWTRLGLQRRRSAPTPTACTSACPSRASGTSTAREPGDPTCSYSRHAPRTAQSQITQAGHTQRKTALRILQQYALSASVKVHLCAGVAASHTCCLLSAASSVRPL